MKLDGRWGDNFRAFADDSEDDAWAAGWSATIHGDTSCPYTDMKLFWAWHNGKAAQLNGLDKLILVC